MSEYNDSCEFLKPSPIDTDRGVKMEYECEKFDCHCDDCPLPQSCKHWHEDGCNYFEFETCLMSICDYEHCPIVDEKYFETI